MPPKKGVAGAKARAAKKQKREADEAKAIVQGVFNERNLITTPGIEQISPAPVVMETQHGNIRIEGEVTPKKLELAKQFDAVFQAATGEVMDLAAYNPGEDVIEFVKRNGFTQEQVDSIKNSKPYTAFTVKGNSFLKTPVNTFEPIQAYCYRLERAVLNQVNVRKQSEEKLNNIISFHLLNTKELQSQIDMLTARLSNKRRRSGAGEVEVFLHEMWLKLGLKARTLFGKLKSTVLSLLTEEKK